MRTRHDAPRSSFPVALLLMLACCFSACSTAPTSGRRLVALQGSMASEGAEHLPAPAGRSIRPAIHHRLGTAEIRDLIVGTVVTPLPDSDGAPYFGMLDERFSYKARPPSAELDYRVQYDIMADGGTYTVENDQLCTRMSSGEARRCRAVYQLQGGRYAFSIFDQPNALAGELRIERIRQGR